MKKINVQFITKTAMLLALTVVFQMIGQRIPLPYNSYFTGTMVNACLLLATAFAGIWSGVTISILAPLTSLLLNHAPVAAALLPFTPVIAIGNIVFILAFFLLRNRSKAAGIAIGSVAKFAILYGGIIGFFKLLEIMGITQFDKFKTVLIGLFFYPQLITAILGGAIALIAIRLLRRQLKLQ